MNGTALEQPRTSSSEWYTPPALFQALGLEFDLDPCAPALPAARWIPARRRIGLPDDGLQASWNGRVWLNPPRDSARWVGRLVEHGHGIALTFARVDTPWWQAAACRASLVCMVFGRVEYIPGEQRFHGRAHAGAPSSLLAYGMDCADALYESRLGMCFVPELLYEDAVPILGVERAAA
jgi:DNA N-6-adenine-methyltransferase (Dam)